MPRYAYPILLLVPLVVGGCVDRLVSLPARTIGVASLDHAKADRRLGRDVRIADARRQRAIDRYCVDDPRDCARD